MSAIANIISAAMATAKQAMGVAVVYTQGTDTFNVTAIPGESKWPAESNAGMVAEIESRDWLIAVADLPNVTPVAGDTVTTADGKIYEVAPPAENLRCFSMERNNTWCRVHTKLTSEG